MGLGSRSRANQRGPIGLEHRVSAQFSGPLVVAVEPEMGYETGIVD